MLKKQLIFFFCFRHLEILTDLRPVQLQRRSKKMKANFRKNCLQIFKSNALTLATLAGVIGGTTRCFFCFFFWGGDGHFLSVYKNIEFILLLALFKHGVNGISLHKKNIRFLRRLTDFFFINFIWNVQGYYQNVYFECKSRSKTFIALDLIKSFSLYIRYCYEDHFGISKMPFIKVFSPGTILSVWWERCMSRVQNGRISI